MKRKEVVILMVALTKGGKTTQALALTPKSKRKKLFKLTNCRTEVTTDWTYDPDAEDIKLKEIQLNSKAVFGVDIEERYTCERFNEILDSEEGQYLIKYFGLEKQEGLSAGELNDYVSARIKEYVDGCGEDGLSKIIKDRLSNRFLRRIKVVLPPIEWLRDYLKEKGFILVLRDTRGLLDIDPEEAKSVQTRSMNELGLDGIDGVLLMGTTAQFADIAQWYKKAYKEALESVPIFIMSRPDSIPMLYDFKYGLDEDNVNENNVKAFLAAAKEANEKGFRDLPNTFRQCYRLLEMFEVGHFINGDFQLNYKVYNNEDMRYVSAYAETLDLDSKTGEVPDYDSVGYKLYELVLFENLKDVLHRILEHIQFTDAIMNQIKNDFVSKIQRNQSISMYPSYRNYNRSDVCNSILEGPILGPRDGIVTVDHGKVQYLGAATSGVSSRVWLREMVYSYEYTGILLNSDGEEIDMPKECQMNLIRMALFNLIEKNTDYHAYFQGWYFMNRYKIKEAITDVRSGNVPEDALDSTSKEIARIVLQ